MVKKTGTHKEQLAHTNIHTPNAAPATMSRFAAKAAKQRSSKRNFTLGLSPTHFVVELQPTVRQLSPSRLRSYMREPQLAGISCHVTMTIVTGGYTCVQSLWITGSHDFVDKAGSVISD